MAKSKDQDDIGAQKIADLSIKSVNWFQFH